MYNSLSNIFNTVLYFISSRGASTHKYAGYSFKSNYHFYSYDFLATHSQLSGAVNVIVGNALI